MSVDVQPHILGIGHGNWKRLSDGEYFLVSTLPISELLRDAMYVIGVGNVLGGFKREISEYKRDGKWGLISAVKDSAKIPLGVKNHRFGLFKGYKVRVR